MITLWEAALHAHRLASPVALILVGLLAWRRYRQRALSRRRERILRRLGST